MKKIPIVPALTILISAISIVLSLCSCNRDMWDTNYTFNKAMRYGDFDGDGAPEWEMLDIDKWRDYDDGSDSVQIETTDGNVYLFHSSNCTLIHED